VTSRARPRLADAVRRDGAIDLELPDETRGWLAEWRVQLSDERRAALEARFDEPRRQVHV
jgi:hypothetical protein